MTPDPSFGKISNSRYKIISMDFEGSCSIIFKPQCCWWEEWLSLSLVICFLSLAECFRISFYYRNSEIPWGCFYELFFVHCTGYSGFFRLILLSFFSPGRIFFWYFFDNVLHFHSSSFLKLLLHIYWPTWIDTFCIFFSQIILFLSFSWL